MAGSSSSSISFSYVGEDVVMNILSRLPVKSILQFKCVCKSWYAIIKSPYFITMHLQRSLTNLNHAPLIVTSHENGSSVWWKSSSSKNEEVLEGVPSPFSRQSTILGPVKGIYCVITGEFTDKGRKDFKIFLYNPALREFRGIPEITTLPPPRSPSIFGFGYDSRSNDFKVVAVTYQTPLEFVSIYSLSSNSWRKIEPNNLPDFEDFGENVFISHGNGVIHRLASVREEKTKVILSFDLGTEVFKNLKLPPGVTYYNPWAPDIPLHKKATLSGFNDSIVLILKPYDNRTGEYYYEIFIMKEYGDEESWTKLYNVGPIFQDHSRPFQLWKNGEFLFSIPMNDEYDMGLVLFDPHGQQIKDLQIPLPFRVYLYMESLVSIN